MSDAERLVRARRSPAARMLLGATLLTALIFGVAFLTIDWLHSTAADAVEHPGPAATDEQTEAEVVEQAKDIVAIAGSGAVDGELCAGVVQEP